MDRSSENDRAAWYQGPMKLEIVKSCVVWDNSELWTEMHMLPLQPRSQDFFPIQI